ERQPALGNVPCILLPVERDRHTEKGCSRKPQPSRIFAVAGNRGCLIALDCRCLPIAAIGLIFTKYHEEEALLTIVLDHTIVPARDKEESARFFARIFGLEYAGPVSHFAPVRINETLTIDFDNWDSF